MNSVVDDCPPRSCADPPVRQHAPEGGADAFARLAFAQVVQHHEGREEQRYRVRHVLVRDVRRAAVDCLEDGAVGPHVRARHDAEAADQATTAMTRRTGDPRVTDKSPMSANTSTMRAARTANSRFATRMVRNWFRLMPIVERIRNRRGRSTRPRSNRATPASA